MHGLNIAFVSQKSLKVSRALLGSGPLYVDLARQLRSELIGSQVSGVAERAVHRATELGINMRLGSPSLFGKALNAEFI